MRQERPYIDQIQDAADKQKQIEVRRSNIRRTAERGNRNGELLWIKGHEVRGLIDTGLTVIS